MNTLIKIEKKKSKFTCTLSLINSTWNVFSLIQVFQLTVLFLPFKSSGRQGAPTSFKSLWKLEAISIGRTVNYSELQVHTNNLGVCIWITITTITSIYSCHSFLLTSITIINLHYHYCCLHLYQKSLTLVIIIIKLNKSYH